MSYIQDQIAFLESITSMLELSGYKPKLDEDVPCISIKLKEMNNVKLIIISNPENFESFHAVRDFSKMLEVRYANVYDCHECRSRFTGELSLVEGWEVLTNYDLFLEHQKEGGLAETFWKTELEVEEPTLIEKLRIRREENLAGGFVAMTSAQVESQRRYAYNYAF